MRVLSDSGEPGCKTAVCFLLQGSKEQILLARCVLENLVIDCEPVTETLEVPQTAFGRIIGILQMLRVTLCPGLYSFFFYLLSLLSSFLISMYHLHPKIWTKVGVTCLNRD